MTAIMNAFHSQNPMFSPSSPPSPSSSRGHNSSSSDTDWRAKYLEVTELLNDTRAELDDFTRASKELEEELERDLERTEKAQEDIRARLSRTESEREDWKAKFLNLQHMHNVTTSSLQRELSATRQTVQLYKDQIRELEMGNDDLERNERQASSSLADAEQKYARALEEKILLEHELQDKAALEETCQRLRDELRDVNLEVGILKDQVAQLKTLPERPHTVHRDSSSSLPFTPPENTEESLLQQEAPDLSLADFALPSPSASRPLSMASIQSGFSQEIICDDRLPASPVSVASFPNSRPNSTMYRERPAVNTSTPTQSFFLQRALSPTSSGASSTSTRLPTPRTRRMAPSPQPASPATPRIPVPSTRAQRSRGVQMVSDMRARVRTLEQKIQFNMPRIPSLGGAAAAGLKGRPPSRAGGGGSALGNARTPRRTPAPNGGSKEPQSPWVFVADDALADTTLQDAPSPQHAPRLPPVPNISPLTTSGIRPPSRAAGSRSVSTLGRPVPSLVAHVAGSKNRSALPPPTAFPSSLADPKDASPAHMVPAASAPLRPSSRVSQLAPSPAASGPPIRRSLDNDRDRAITPTFLTRPHPTVSDILRRTHTLSSPTKPKAHVTEGVLPRQRKDSSPQAKARIAGPNVRDAGLTPGKVKQRSATSPEPPPPVPLLPADMHTSSGRMHAGATGANALGKSRIGTSRTGSSGLPLGASRLGRPSVGSSAMASGQTPGDSDPPSPGEENAGVRVTESRARSGTTGSAR